MLVAVASFSYLMGKLSQKKSSPEDTEVKQNDALFPSISGSSKLLPSITNSQNSPTPVTRTVIISATPDLDGFRASDNSGNNASEIKIGRNKNIVSRGFVSFDLSQLPSGAAISDATLKLYQAKVSGRPYNFGINLKIDHLTYGDNLDFTDYGLAALSSSFANLSENGRIEWKEAAVTEKVRNDISNARSQSQFRIHFQSELTGGNEDGDFVHLESAENALSTGNLPQLVVRYF